MLEPLAISPTAARHSGHRSNNRPDRCSGPPYRPPIRYRSAHRLGQSEVSQTAERIARKVDVRGVARHDDEEDQDGV